MQTEVESLQNAANKANLKVNEYYFEDKRKTNKKYFLTHNGTTISPVLNYDTLNHFILGFNRAKEILTN